MQARKRTGTGKKKKTKTIRRGCFLLVGKKQGGAHRKLGYDKSRTQERPKGHPKEFAFACKQNKKKKGRQQQETQKTFQKVEYPRPE